MVVCAYLSLKVGANVLQLAVNVGVWIFDGVGECAGYLLFVGGVEYRLKSVGMD